MWRMTPAHLEWLAEIATCPACGAPLAMTGAHLTCRGCARVYPQAQGYISLMPAEWAPELQGEADYHSRVAPRWAELVGLDSPKTRMLHGDFLSDLRAAIPPGSTILETGCGGGQDAAELVRSGYRYVGVDVSCGMLDASARAFTGGDADDPAYGRILLCQAEGEQLPFRKGMFDAALIVSALHHMRRPDRCLAQIAHCLRPGGILVAGSEPNSWPYTIRRLRRSRWGRRLGLHRQTYFPPRDGSPADFEMAGFSRSELASMFRGQGFDVLSMKSFWHLSALSCLLPRLPRVVEERICVPVDRVLSGWPVCRSWGMHWNVVARLHRAGGAA